MSHLKKLEWVARNIRNKQPTTNIGEQIKVKSICLFVLALILLICFLTNFHSLSFQKLSLPVGFRCFNKSQSQQHSVINHQHQPSIPPAKTAALCLPFPIMMKEVDWTLFDLGDNEIKVVNQKTLIILVWSEQASLTCLPSPFNDSLEWIGDNRVFSFLLLFDNTPEISSDHYRINWVYLTHKMVVL